MKFLNEDQLNQITTMLPKGSLFLIVVATKDGTGMDTNFGSENLSKIPAFLRKCANDIEGRPFTKLTPTPDAR